MSDTAAPTHTPRARGARLLRGAWRWARRGIYLLGALVVVALVSLAAAQVFVNTDAGRQQVTKLLSGVLDQDVTASSLELHLLSGLSIKDLKLTPRGELAAHPFLVTDELTLGYSLSELVHGTLRIDQLALNGASVAIVFRGAHSNIPLAGGAPPAPTAAVAPAAATTPPAAPPTAAPAAAAPPPQLAPGLAPAPAPTTTPSPRPRGLVLPVLPLAIAIDALKLADVSVVVDLDGKLLVESHGLDLSLHGTAGPGGADLALTAGHRAGPEHDVRMTVSGARPIALRSQLELDLTLRGSNLDRLAAELRLALPGASVDLGGGPHTVTAKLEARGTTELSKATATLDPVTLDLGAGGSIALRAGLDDFLAAPRIDATISHGRLVLGELVPIAAAFLPELSASGTVEIENLTARGNLGGGTASDPFTATGRIALVDLAASYPAATLEARGLTGGIELERVALVHYRPTALSATANVALASATLPASGRIEELTLALGATANGADFHDVHARADVRAAKLIPPGLGADAKPLALDASAATAADLTSGDLTGIEVRARVPGALDVRATGDVAAFGKGAVKLATSVEVQPGPLLAWIPPSLLGGLPAPKAAGTAKLDAAVTGDLGPRTLAAHGTLTLAKLAASNLPARSAVRAVDGTIRFDATLGEGFQPGPAQLDGRLTLAEITALDALRVQTATVALGASAAGLPLDAASAKLELAVKGAAYRSKTLEAPPQDLRLVLAARGNPTRGDLVLENLELAVNRVARFTAKANARAFGNESLEAEAHLSGLDLATLALKLPHSLESAVAGVSATGAPTLDVRVKGRLPSPVELESLTLPLEGRVSFELPKGSLRWPARELAVGKATTRLTVAFDPANVSVALDATAFEVVDKPHLGADSRDFSATVRVSLADRDRLAVEQIYLGVLNRGAFAFVGGELAGLRSILDGRVLPPVGELLRTLAGRFEVDAGFDRPTASQIAPGFTVKGGASARLAAKLRPGRDLAIDGQAFFADLEAKAPPTLDVTGLTGRFPIQKTLAIIAPDARARSGDGAARRADADAAAERNRSLYGALRPLSANRDNVRLANLLAGPLAAHDIYLDVAFHERALAIQRFGVGLLSGWAGGSAETSFSAARNRLALALEFGEIDVRRLLPLESPLADEQAQVSGTARISLDLARGEVGGKGTVSLGDVNADLNLTRIGEEALDQLLVFLDPKGDQGSIGTFRTILRTTDLTINRVQIPIQNGSLSMRVEYGIHAHVPRFLEQALNIVYDTTNRFEIPAIPLLRLQNVEKLKPLFDQLASLQPILDIVGGDHIRIEPDGSFRIE
ncbi:MAG: hypothetical protein U0610_00180 [bacterium]